MRDFQKKKIFEVYLRSMYVAISKVKQGRFPYAYFGVIFSGASRGVSEGIP